MTKLAIFAFSIFTLILFPDGVFAQKTAKKFDVIKQYSICTFNDGLKIKDTYRLDEDSIRARPVETRDGLKEVSRTESFYVLVEYPKMSPFANIRPERSQLIKSFYDEDKQNVIAALQHFIDTSKDMESAAPAKASVNGFELYSLNRKSLNGSTLAINVLFNESDFTITTIYFFNAKPAKRNFQTVEEWRKLKDSFLDTYTNCINTNLGR